VISFSEFYSSHRERLFGYLMRSTGDYHLSNDIMQESFKRYLERYGHEIRSAPLLYTIARNAFLDHTRKKRKDSPYEEDCGYEPANPEHHLMVREEYRGVLAALQKLESTEREILALVVSSDLSYREIASVTGITEANVKVKVHRARVKLKQILEGR
jgi:RNA polymerase sigma-70 factor (ECF subfamily)